MHQMAEKNRSAYFFNLDLHRSGWDRWCFMSHVFFFFLLSFFSPPAWMLITRTAAIIKQLWVCTGLLFPAVRRPSSVSPLPKRKHSLKCKPVAPPETAGLLSDRSVVSNRSSAPRNKRGRIGLGENGIEICEVILLYPHSMRLVAPPVHSPRQPCRTKFTGLVGTCNCLNSEMADKFLYSLNVLYYCF